MGWPWAERELDTGDSEFATHIKDRTESVYLCQRENHQRPHTHKPPCHFSAALSAFGGCQFVAQKRGNSCYAFQPGRNKGLISCTLEASSRPLSGHTRSTATVGMAPELNTKYTHTHFLSGPPRLILWGWGGVWKCAAQWPRKPASVPRKIPSPPDADPGKTDYS